jgi:hypothetical protein
MTTPTMTGGRRPAFAEPPAEPPLGPDFSQTLNDPPLSDAAKPRPSFRDRVQNTKLGKNKKVRSDVRKLTADDETVLRNWYERIGKILQPFRPELGEAIATQAEDCARCWCELADKNDKIRHMILAVIEGGEWGKLVGAHVPIIMAALPDRVVERFMLKGMGMFSNFLSSKDSAQETDESDDASLYNRLNVVPMGEPFNGYPQ